MIHFFSIELALQFELIFRAPKACIFNFLGSMSTQIAMQGQCVIFLKNLKILLSFTYEMDLWAEEACFSLCLISP